jgi:hypothetical protein
MNVIKIAASQVEAGMYCAEVDEDVPLEEMDLDAMDWQRVVEVRHRYGYEAAITFAYHNAKDGTHTSIGSLDQLLYVETDEQGHPLTGPMVAHEDDWACDFTD